MSTTTDTTTGTTNDTTTDTTTGLQWEDLTESAGIHCLWDLYTWADATSVKIAALNAAKFGGHDDWRLPTSEELLTLVDRGRVNPACRSEFLPMQSDYYWSSTPYQDLRAFAWVVNFYGGDTGAGNKTYYNYVRAVRGGTGVQP